MHTLCFTGFSKKDETEIKALFDQANARSGHHWRQAPEAEAQILVIDMDSIYGHMTWLKADGSGKTTVGVTSGLRSETDFLLTRPLNAEAMAALLSNLYAKTAPTSSRPAAVTTEAPPMAAPVPPPAAAPAPAPAPVPAPEAVAPARAPEPVPAPAVVPEPEPAPAAVAHPDPHLADWLVPGALDQPAMFQLGDAPPLVLDPASKTYLGGTTLKPLAPYATGVLREDDARAVNPAELPALKTKLGGAHPWSRLLWFISLTAGNGALVPGIDPNAKFKLNKWPQTEREYPKHFRVATTMMKGPATLTDIAAASSVPLAEVIDFVNASLTSGVAEAEGHPLSAAEQSTLPTRFRRGG